MCTLIQGVEQPGCGEEKQRGEHKKTLIIALIFSEKMKEDIAYFQ